MKPIFIAWLLLATITNAYAKNKKTMLKKNEQAPAFTVKDVHGKTVKVPDADGAKIFISFHRNVGCPVCNLRFHEIEQEMEYFGSHGVKVVAVYESDSANILRYLDGDTTGTIMVGDPTLALYQQYKVERSWVKTFSSMFNGIFKKMKAGNRLFKNKMKQDGNLNRLPASFLIDGTGKIILAHYAKYVGDEMPLELLKQHIE
ncbi:MAG TPA: redoxin domain-containing protein [Flavipsychrobacter sp.]